MPEDKSFTGKSIGLFLVGCFLFSYPVLTIFNLSFYSLGIPPLFLYLFSAWILLILLTPFATPGYRSHSPSSSAHRHDDTAFKGPEKKADSSLEESE